MSSDSKTLAARLRAQLERHVGEGPIRAILRGAGTAMILRSAGAALTLGFQVLFARWLGDFEYGVFVYALSLVSMLAMIASFGMNEATMRFAPEYRTRKRWSRLRGLRRRFLALAAIGGIMIGGLGGGIIAVLGDAIASHYQPALLIAMLCVPLFAVADLYSAHARAFGRIWLAYFPTLIGRPGLVLLGAALAFAVGAAASAATGLFVAVCGAAIALSIQALAFERGTPAELRNVKPSYHTRLWLRVAFPLFIAHSFILVLAQTDLLMIGLWLGPTQVALYGASLKVAAVTTFIAFAMSALSVPKFAELYSDGKIDELQKLVRSVAQWTFWPSLAVGIGLCVLGKPILWLFGPEFQAGYTVLILVVGATVIHAMAGPVISLLEVTGNHDAAAVVLGGAAVFNIAANAILIPLHGIVGAATATILTAILMRVVLVITVKRRVGVALAFTSVGKP